MFDRCPLASVLLILTASSPALLSTGTDLSVDDEEFCERETFEGSCASDEVMLIRRAVFGRMNIGRCVETGYGKLGCSADVVPEVENLCSGRQRCQFPVGSLHFTRPCPAELISFLKVSYDCVKVMTCSDYSCNSGQSMKVTLSEGYLASVVTLATGCGSESCPWVLQALPGQHFNLTFRSFARVQSSSSSSELLEPHQHQHQQSERQQQQQQQQQVLLGRFCQRLATVTELSSHVSKDVTLCDNDVAIVRLMTSAHDQVKLKLYCGTPDNPAYFIVRYEVIGCPDPEVPQGAWMRRSGNTATVGCHGKSTTWQLTCNGISWSGGGETQQPCSNSPSSDVATKWGVQAAMEKAGATTEGILVVVGLGVIIGVFVGCFLLAVVVIIVKRRRRKQVLQYERRLELLTNPSPGVDTEHQSKPRVQKHARGGGGGGDGPCEFHHQIAQSLVYDSGFGTYEAHSYTSPLPGPATMTNLGVLHNSKAAAAAAATTTTEQPVNCLVHGDHFYESHTSST